MAKDALHLYYDPRTLPLIRSNSRTKLLSPLYDRWKAVPVDRCVDLFRKAAQSGDLIHDYYEGLYVLSQSTLIQLVEPTRERGDTIREAIGLMTALPYWDYFREDKTQVIGFQRAPWGVKVILFARQVIRESIDDAFDQRILEAVAMKGCLPCYRTVYGMDNPEEVKGWGFDDRHEGFYDLDMARWPMIVGANNLRADPSAALGIGALALQGIDGRADLWLDTAMGSLRRVMSFFEPDGSFFEAISYAAYTLRTTCTFYEAHERVVGDVDWGSSFDWDRLLDFILVSQAGRNPQGDPDVMNFGDTFGSINPCVPSWIGSKTGNPVAQFVVENVSNPAFFLDFLWYRPERPAREPSAALLNVCTDLDWVFCRTGWEPDDAALGFRSGGPSNHEHADRNSFIFKIHGERLLNDPFGADYDWRKPRWILRLTEAHNTVLVGGSGQQYHRGEEGTNDGLSYANVTRFEDSGHLAWWTSDATPAYRIDNYHIFKVRRTVVFSKPGDIVLLDQVQLRYRPQTLDIRFHPDNRDGKAALQSDGGNGFIITRPAARLHGRVFARSGFDIRVGRLDVPDDAETFPFIEIHSGKTLQHEVLTLLTASGSADAISQEDYQVQPIEEGWRLRVGRLEALVLTSGPDPLVKLL